MKTPTRRQLLRLALAAGGVAGGVVQASLAGAESARLLVGDPLETPAPRRRPDRVGLMLDLAWAGARLVAVGEGGLVLWSEDQGVSWHQTEVPVSVTLTAVSFADAQRGWAVGHSGVVLQTIDGGTTWRLQLDGRSVGEQLLRDAQASADAAWVREAEQAVADGPDKAVFDVHVAADGRGWMVGAYGLALTTRDGGQQWQALAPRAVPNPKARHLYAISVQGEDVFLCGEQGLLLAGRGAQFEALPSPYVGSFFGLVPGPDEALLAFGLRGHAFRSTDRGRQWQPVELGAAGSLMTGGRLRDGRLLLADEAGKLLLGDAVAQRFAPLVQQSAAYVSAWTQAPDGHLVLAGARGLSRMDLPTMAATS